MKAASLPKHEKKSVVINLRLTPTERAMLRTLAIRSTHGSDSGWIRAMIREAWAAREARKLTR